MKAKEKSDFGKLEEEYNTVRRNAGLMDLSHRGRIAVTGKDRKSFLHRLLSIDVNNLKPGECITGCFLTGSAKIQCLLDIIDGGETIWLDTHESRAAHVAALLEKFHFNEQVAFENVSGKYAELALEGPAIAKFIKPFRDCAVLSYQKSISGEPGERFWVPAEKARRLKESGVPVIGEKALNALRIEAGEPLFGVDIDESMLQPETGRDEWASVTKGCYAGQEIIQRVRNFAHPVRLLIKLEVAAKEEDFHGAKILSEDREIGTVTSSAYSPGNGNTVALGRVIFEQAGDGKRVQVQISEKQYSAVIKRIQV